jgi:hypothetical protein
MMFEGVRTLVATMVMQPNPQKRSEEEEWGMIIVRNN